MKKILVPAALLVAMPTLASAQALPAAIVGVVNVQKVLVECTACKAGSAALQAQFNAGNKFRDDTLGPLNAEGKALQDQVNALGDKEPDAALKAKVDNFNKRMGAAQQQVALRGQQIENNGGYVKQQITAQLAVAIRNVMTRRGANLMVDTNATLDNGDALEVTAEVMAELNKLLPSVVTTAPAPKPAATTPAATRPATTTAAPRPKPKTR